EYTPTRATLERLAAATRVPLALLEVLVPTLLWLQRLARGGFLARGADSARDDLVRTAQEVAASELTWALRELPSPLAGKGTLEDDASRSEVLVMWLCEESIRAAADDSSRARRLAESALKVAQGAEASEAQRARL